jgi:serine/threonine protein kinase/DNA-binding beta-propeller fold protein YncE
MPAQIDCPRIECWSALFDGTFSSEERERCERHLESCLTCQARLDRTEEDAIELLTLVRQVGDLPTEPLEPSLVQFLERLHDVKSAERTTPVEPADLYFLRPSDREGVLGTLGVYEVREVIGQGGMGVVLKAFEPALHRLVAIKVMAAAVAGSATARRRFTREAQAAAAVCHDNIVAVHGVHEADGLPYLVMQYVAGESLQARLDRTGPLQVEEIVQIGLQTAAGLAAAHAQGLIHRDIKPANLLLENGLARVKITDFGLARMVDDVQLTQNGAVAGTPEYMAPEQARGEAVDHRADLFSLGSVLYAVCTGLPPFRGSSAVAVLRQVSDLIPTPIRSLNPDAPAWLETLITGLMEKDPLKRFQSAAEVAGLLEGYLAHLRQPATVAAPELASAPLATQPSGHGDAQTKRSRQRFQVLVTAVVAALGLGLALWLAGSGSGTSSNQDYYHSFKGNADFTKDFELDGLDPDQCLQFEPAGMRITLPAGHPGKRLGTGLVTTFPVKGDCEITIDFEILKEPGPEDAGEGTGVYLWADLDTASMNRGIITRGVWPGRQFYSWFDLSSDAPGKPPFQELEFRPTTARTGRLRLVRTGSVLSCYAAEESSDEFILIRQHSFGTEDLKAVHLGGQTGGPKAALEARVTELRIRAKSAADLPAAQRQAGSKSWLAAGLVLGLAATLACALGVWFWARRGQRTGGESALAPGRDNPEPAAFISLRCSSCASNLKAKTALAGKKLKCPKCGKVVLVPATSPMTAPPSTARGTNNSLLPIVFWVLGPIILVPVFLCARYVAFFQPSTPPAGLLNVALGCEPVAEVEESGFSFQEYDKEQQPFRWTDGHATLVIPIDKTRPPQALALQLSAFRGHGVKHATVQILVNRQPLFNGPIPMGVWEKTLALKGLDLGEKVEFEIISDTFIPLDNRRGDGRPVSEDARTLGVQVKAVRLLSMVNETREQAAPSRILDISKSHPQGIAHGVLAPDGKTLLAGSWDGTFNFWDTAANQEPRSLPGPRPFLETFAVSPTGKGVAVATNDRVIRIWDVQTGQPGVVLRGHQGQITSLAFSPDGQTLASAGGDRNRAGELKLWNVTTGQERLAIDPFQKRLWGVAYAPNGETVAVASGNNTTQTVDARTGKVLATFDHPSYAHGVAFSPDGKLLAVSYGDKGFICIYELESGRQRPLLQGPSGAYVGRPEFAADSKRLVAPCIDDAVVVWDVSKSEAQVATTLTGHQGPVRIALFLPDGRTVATGDDKTIRLWNVPEMGPLSAAQPDAHVSPPLEIAGKIGLAAGGILVLALIAALCVYVRVRQGRRGGTTTPPPAGQGGQAKTRASESIRTSL